MSQCAYRVGWCNCNEWWWWWQRRIIIITTIKRCTEGIASNALCAEVFFHPCFSFHFSALTNCKLKSIHSLIRWKEPFGSSKSFRKKKEFLNTFFSEKNYSNFFFRNYFFPKNCFALKKIQKFKFYIFLKKYQKLALWVR